MYYNANDSDFFTLYSVHQRDFYLFLPFLKIFKVTIQHYDTWVKEANLGSGRNVQ